MSIIDWLQKNNPQLLDELLLLDRVLDGALLHDPTHTLSYNIAKASMNHNFFARMLCHILSVLSKDHCKNALLNESTQLWKDSVIEVG